MAVGDVYKLVTEYSLLGVPCKNRYYYKEISATTGNTTDVVDAWIGQVYPAIQDIQNEGCALIKATCINLMNPLDFYETVVVGALGTITGDALPPFNVWRFRLDRDDRTFRPGRKAIAGVSESSVTNGVAVPTLSTELNAVADALAAVLVTPVEGASIRPKLIRELAGIVTAEAKITGAAYVEVSSQNTRKFGRGE